MLDIRKKMVKDAHSMGIYTIKKNKDNLGDNFQEF
jgi:hypothetical protein